MNKKIIFQVISGMLLFFLAPNDYIFGQTKDIVPMHKREYNLTTITYNSHPTIHPQSLIEATAMDLTHPDLGQTAYDAGSTYREQIGKRTASSRSYANDSGGFAIQKCLGNLNYQDSEGHWVAYDRRLRPDTNELGTYLAPAQETPAKISVTGKFTSFMVNENEIQFNKNLHLKNVSAGGETLIDYGEADWLHFTIGDDGIHIFDVWPGIDAEITLDLYKIKSNFIIKSPLNISEGYLIIEDHLNIPSGYHFKYTEGSWAGSHDWNGSVQIESPDAESYYVEIGRAIAFDSGYINNSSIYYDFDSSSNVFQIKTPSNWLNDPSVKYPVTIDPLVSTSAVYSTGIMYYQYNGSFCIGGINPDCGYTLNVPLPYDVTLTACTFNFQFVTVNASGCMGSCAMNKTGFQIVGPCATSPASNLWWSCNFNGIGTCTAVNYDMFATVSCLTPVCNGSIDFIANNSRCDCSNNPSCAPAGTPCTTSPANSFSVTLTGKNPEVLGNTSSGNGTLTVTEICCIPSILNPAPLYGVPPYSYLWSNGATTSTLTVTNCTNGTYNYTCTITDACAVTRTGTFTVKVTDCILPIELSSFTGTFNGRDVDLNWTTQSEKDNEYFVIERSFNGEDFDSLGTIKGAGTSNIPLNYSFTDHAPRPVINYYSLKQVDLDGNSKNSSIISVETPPAPEIQVYPSPAKDHITVFFSGLSSTLSTADIRITDMFGNVALTSLASVRLTEQKTLDVSNLPNGQYFISVRIIGYEFHFRFIKD
ncbi:MAG: T9SS type A sorting domain-containing protein [Chitinophagales bacterium]